MEVTTQLRDYQHNMLQALDKAWRRTRSVMVQMPTGTGKTVLLAEVIRKELRSEAASSKGKGEQKGGVLVVAHRRELIEQIKRTIDSFGTDREHVLVESIQKLAKRGLPLTPFLRPYGDKRPKVERPQTRLPVAFPKREGNFKPSLVIVDEAHHALAKTYKMLWERWPEAKFLGLTATPCRLSGEPFTDLFDVLLQSWSIQEFIDKGWLSDFEYVSASPDSEAMKQIRQLKKRGADGDYQTKEMATVMDVPESVEHLYRTYRQFANGKKGIVYAIDRQHAQHIADCYRQHGVNCAVIDAKTPAEERRRIIEEYKAPPTAPEGASLAGALSVLINVDIFSEGFDAPEVEFIQLARPTLSLPKYLQQVGRGMRISKGKSQVLILDQVGLYQRFGLPTAERNWQQLFLGKEAGRGTLGLERCVAVDDEPQDKELVNLEMVRIKKAGRKGAGLEIFLQDGHYGVMRNGRITCPARFKRMERLQSDCSFFALGVYMERNERDLGRLVEVKTVIDKKGQDLQVKLYGRVTWQKDYFCAIDTYGGYSYVNCWDPVGNSYYLDTYPEFQFIAGVEVGWAREYAGADYRCLKLRQSTGKVSPRFDEWEVFYNRNIVIARDYLIVKKDKNHSYRIKGYYEGSVLVESENDYGYQQFFPDGKEGQLFRKMPEGYTQVLNYSKLGLQRAIMPK